MVVSVMSVIIVEVVALISVITAEVVIVMFSLATHFLFALCSNITVAKFNSTVTRILQV